MSSAVPEQLCLAVDYTNYLQQIVREPKNSLDAELALERIAAIINKETEMNSKDSSGVVNPVILNLAFRSYYRLMYEYRLKDVHFERRLREQFSYEDESSFLMLYSVLLTDHWKQLNGDKLKDSCTAALIQSIAENSSNTLAIVKVLNLLCRKFPSLELDLPLESLYYYMQNGQSGSRDETLVLFSHCCKSSEQAFRYFQIICEFWPWTNRNKYYLLSCILKTHNLQEFLSCGGYDSKEFFSGIRISLSYKILLASSQYLIKSLSSQGSKGLIELSVEILFNGSRKELQNFNSQWFSRIEQKEELFDLLRQKSEIAQLLESSQSLADLTESYRFVLIFNMFSKQIFQLSKLHFFKISTELITNCFQFEVETQLFIFRFVMDNLCNFSIEDTLDFVLAFIKHHKCVESAQFRNNVLGRMAPIINYVSRNYFKMRSTAQCESMEASVESFFRQLHKLIDEEMTSNLYQPQIFLLKLLEILLKSLYAENVQKNAKNCHKTQNRLLGEFLLERNVFDAARVSHRLMSLMDDPTGYDDVQELIVSLLKQLNVRESFRESMTLCKNYCKRCDIDECALTSYYASIALTDGDYSAEMFEFALDALETELPNFNKDPLLICKTRNHIFPYINVLNEVFGSQNISVGNKLSHLANLLSSIVNDILDMLNLAALQKEDAATKAADFQIMDESLDILIRKSVCSIDSPEDARKFLLMSFWLTLKACCDLATAIGCVLVISTEPESQTDLAILETCLQINVDVLTRCRHKGAIESAGQTIGVLTKCITTHLESHTQAYQLLKKCLHSLFDDSTQVSNTRRGAGFSIMFLHVIKNEHERNRPLLHSAMTKIFLNLERARLSPSSVNATFNYDRIEALSLHYLCVLVKDAELRDAMTKYYNEIMMSAIAQIDNPEWTICNAALQLFGALVPKIVGQKQSSQLDEIATWLTSEVTYGEIAKKLPKFCEHVLSSCRRITSTRSVILFLSFLANVDHLRCDFESGDHEILRFRELMWKLLEHKCEKVRKLAAHCFVRMHEFRCDLPQALISISNVIYKVKNENFFEGLVLVLLEGVHKMQCESKHTLDLSAFNGMLFKLRVNLSQNFEYKHFKLYTLSKLLELYVVVGLDSETPLVKDMIQRNVQIDEIGHDYWFQGIENIRSLCKP